MGLGLEVLAYYGEGGEGEVALDDDGAEGEDQGGVADNRQPLSEADVGVGHYGEHCQGQGYVQGDVF